MALDNDTIVKLIQQLDADRKAYVRALEQIQDSLTQALQSQLDGPSPRHTIPSLQTDPSHTALPSSNVILWPTATNKPLTIDSLSTAQSSHILERLNPARHLKDSPYVGDGSSDSDDDESFFAQETLPPRDFSENDLIEHLKTYPWDIYSKYILQDLLRNIDLLYNGIFLKDRHHQTDANHQHADIYHISTDGAPLRLSRGDSDEGPLAAWEALKGVNFDTSRRQAVGRIIIVREPASSLFAALHLIMNEDFDMDSIYRILIDDHTPTKAITRGYLKKDHRRQRSVVFVFKYHTIVGEGRAPLQWQNHDDEFEPKDGHIPLATCSSVVALSLTGKPAYTLRRNSRKTKSVLGHVHDPFAPWQVLSIQCFPDWNSSVETHEHNHHYCNGPDAFLVSLLSEYRDAIKRLKKVHKSIQDLATPPNRSIFDSALRDELLFENNKFTYSRRYFWASQTLGLMSNEIRDMIAAYKDTFTDEFWSGEHKTLFPGTKDQSPRYSNWRKKLTRTRRQFEKEIAQLEEVFGTFQEQQKQIKNYREWLYAGTSVLESREAVSMAKITVDQGYNIRLLTMVTLFYLPLSYVTGIYGMTNMPVNGSFLPFALTTVGICLPTYLLILAVSNLNLVKTGLAYMGFFVAKLTSIPAPRRSEKLKEKMIERRLPKSARKQHEMHKAATFASLEARLSQDLSDEPPLVGSQGFMQATRRMSKSISKHLSGAPGKHPSGGTTQTSSRPPAYSGELSELAAQPQPSDGIRFEEPFYKLKDWRLNESQGTIARGRDKSASNPSIISPTECPPLPVVVIETPNGSILPSPLQRDTLRPPDPRRERSVSPMSDGRRSLLGRLSSPFSSAMPSPRTLDPGSPAESV